MDEHNVTAACAALSGHPHCHGWRQRSCCNYELWLRIIYVEGSTLLNEKLGHAWWSRSSLAVLDEGNQGQVNIVLFVTAIRLLQSGTLSFCWCLQ